jgi:hypothetical protein
MGSYFCAWCKTFASFAGVVHSLKDISITSSPLSKLQISSGGGAFSLSIDDIDCFSFVGEVCVIFDVVIALLLPMLFALLGVARRLSHRRRSYAILLAIFLKPILVPATKVISSVR